jgi:serine/threonine protein kinase
LAKLNHPNVLRIVGWRLPDQSDNGQIDTEYAPHGSLTDLLRSIHQGEVPPFGNPTGIGIMICGIVLGMRYVHFSGIINGDLQPSNILLNEKGYPLITDFRSSRFESDDATPIAGGTFYYAAPEQFDEGAVLTRKTDVFTFRLILYELLVGEPVFSLSESRVDVIRRLQARALPAVPESCGSFMGSLVRRCWLPNPEDRPSFKEILSDMQDRGFAILRNAVSTDMEDFCEAILAWERGAGIWQ